jgi:Fe-S oxidoreductase
MSINQSIYIPMFAVSVLFFVYSCYRRLQLISLGTAENRTNRPVARLVGMFTYAFAQKRVVQRPFGVNHSLLFWAFLVLVLANGEFLLAGLFPSLSLALLPEPLHHALTIAFDVVSLLTLACVALAFARRLFFAPDYLGNEYSSPRSGEALLILAMISTLMLAFFILNGAQIALGDTATSRPVSLLFGKALAGLPVAFLENVALASWWVHAVVLLVFMNVLPRSKHMHILTAIPNTYFRNLEKPNTQPCEEFTKGKRFGVGEVENFNWKDLFDSLTCTECGRCQDLCPAYSTGKQLNPRSIVHDIKVNLMQNGPELKDGKSGSLPMIGKVQAEGSCSEESLWDCTTCGSCVSVCPVLIEQMPKIVKMRRYLVQEKAQFPEELTNLFENFEQRSNPWGMAPSDRAKWSSQLDVKPFEKGQTEYLFYAGCAGSFDARIKQVTVNLALILDKAGISWGTLGKDEKCCGDSLRRLGNEFVFDRMAKENVQMFKDRGIQKVITACPHCLTTLRNDYRQYGIELEVVHHTELISRLLAEGKIKMNKHVEELGKIIVHDSCYLGRHNDIYDAPRDVLSKVSGEVPLEFDRNREKSFCCGAGGGRMWLEEQTGERINRTRVKEAMEKEPDTICVSCPFCMTMFEDGLKDEQIQNVRVRDLTEIVAEGIR